MIGRFHPARTRSSGIVALQDSIRFVTVNTNFVVMVDDVDFPDYPTLRNVAASYAQYACDFISVSDLLPYVCVIEKWLYTPANDFTFECRVDEEPSEAAGAFLLHNVFDYKFPDVTVADNGYKFADLMAAGSESVIQSSAFRKAVFFISAAMRYADHTPAFCIQAVEAVRAHFDDPLVMRRKPAWNAMHQALATETICRRIYQKPFQAEKHGAWLERSWTERATLLASSIEVAFRFGLYLRGELAQALNRP